MVEKIIFHTTLLEENLRNKALLAVAALAVMYFATTRLIAEPLLSRVSQGLSSFTMYMAYAICQEKISEKGAEKSEQEPMTLQLHAAAVCGFDIVDSLLKGGAKVDIQNNLNQTPLELADTTEPDHQKKFCRKQLQNQKIRIVAGFLAGFPL